MRTGSPLLKNGLEEQEVILRSEAWLIANPEELEGRKKGLLDQLLFHMTSVLAARYNRYLLMNAPGLSAEMVLKN